MLETVFALISIGVLATIFFWSIYHLPILFVGIRRKSSLKGPYKEFKRLPKVSLIVPTKDEEAVIGHCLEALLSLDYPKEKTEIVVVDGSSKDRTLEIVNKFSGSHPGVIRILSQQEPTGKPAALNLALPHLKGEIVGIFDADNVPPKDVLRRTVWYFQDPSVVAVQGRTCSLNENKNMLTKIVAKEEKAWWQTLVQGREALGLFIPLAGNCQFVRRRVLEELKGWKENALTEDVELSLRLVGRGYSVRYAPDVYSRLETPSKFRNLATQHARWYRGYMEAALSHGRLLRKPSMKILDAEITLTGPYMMVLCFFSYFIWVIGALIFPQKLGSLSSPAALAVALTLVEPISIGIALAFKDKPRRLKNLLWIPFVYVYWFVKTAIAAWAFLQLLLRRPKVWKKTIKGV